MKANRQDKIIEIIQQNDIETQEELAHLLAAAGFHVTRCVPALVGSTSRNFVGW